MCSSLVADLGREQVARASHSSGDLFLSFNFFLIGALCISVVQNLTSLAQLLQPLHH